MNPSFRNFVIWVAVAALLLVLFQVFQHQTQQAGPQEIAYSTFRADVDHGDVKEVTIVANRINGKRNNDSTFTTLAPDDVGLVETMYKAGEVADECESGPALRTAAHRDRATFGASDFPVESD